MFIERVGGQVHPLVTSAYYVPDIVLGAEGATVDKPVLCHRGSQLGAQHS